MNSNKIKIHLSFILFLLGLFALSITGCNNSTKTEKDTEEIFNAPDIDWIKVKAGSFIFGSSDDVPCKAAYSEKEVNVTLTHDFLMAKTELTQKQWTALGFDNPSQKPIGDNYPVRFIDFYEAAAWCNKLSELEGLDTCYNLTTCTGTVGEGCKDDEWCFDTTYNCTGNIHKYASYYDCPGYRLPTTAEWEYAAKAGTETATYAGNIDVNHKNCILQKSLEDIAWYCNNSNDEPHPVAKKTPNPWGLYDIIGNVNEWVDYWDDGQSLNYLSSDPSSDITLIDPVDKLTGDTKAIRGSSFKGYNCFELRAAFSLGLFPDNRDLTIDFRPVKTVFK